MHLTSLNGLDCEHRICVLMVRKRANSFQCTYVTKCVDTVSARREIARIFSRDHRSEFSSMLATPEPPNSHVYNV